MLSFMRAFQQSFLGHPVQIHVKMSQGIHLGPDSCLKKQILRREKAKSRNDLGKGMLIVTTEGEIRHYI